MLSPVEAWWAGLCARVFNKLRLQAFFIYSLCSFYSKLLVLMTPYGRYFVPRNDAFYYDWNKL